MEEPNDVVGDRLLRDLLVPRNNSSNVTFSISAGGVGVWVAVTACITMLAMNVGLGVMYVDLSRKYDRTQDYLNTIYVWAPHLKEKPKQEKP